LQDRPDPLEPHAADPRRPLSVTALVAAARGALERDLGAVIVAGEVTGFLRAASGHCYFGLKDASAQVRCVLWRTKARFVDFALKDGLAVEVRAMATLYEPRGEFQLSVDSVRLAGAGALYERFAQLKARLEAQGWFAPERKRPLPAYPAALGIVTSLKAAALQDVLSTLARRWPVARVVIYPAPVQGAGAADELAAAIGSANTRREVQALIVCRGGGSIEDLWAFNEEVLARAVFESELPVVSGVGHETDFTICDFVADVRAPTPTGAAALLTPDRVAILHRVDQWAARASRAAQHMLATRIQRVDLASRALLHPAARIAAQRETLRTLAARAAAAQQRHLAVRGTLVASLRARVRRELLAPLPGASRLDLLRGAWHRAGRLRLERSAQRLAALEQNLNHLSPQQVLERGYAIVSRPDGSTVVDAATLRPGDSVDLQFARGSAGATIKP
jgi:exodeoxyribonuclease VII large subunit